MIAPASASLFVQMSLWDVTFVVLVIGILLTMTGAFGDPNLVLVGVVVSLAAIVGMFLGPYTTPVAIAALIPIIGFLLFYIHRHVEFPHNERPEQTSAAHTLAGKTGVVVQRVTPRGGEIELDRGGGFDKTYRARSLSGTLEPGDRAIVVDPGGGNVVTVAREGEVDPESISERPSPARTWKVVDDARDALKRLRSDSGD